MQSFKSVSIRQFESLSLPLYIKQFCILYKSKIQKSETCKVPRCQELGIQLFAEL